MWAGATISITTTITTTLASAARWDAWSGETRRRPVRLIPWVPYWVPESTPRRLEGALIPAGPGNTVLPTPRLPAGPPSRERVASSPAVLRPACLLHQAGALRLYLADAASSPPLLRAWRGVWRAVLTPDAPAWVYSNWLSVCAVLCCLRMRRLEGAAPKLLRARWGCAFATKMARVRVAAPADVRSDVFGYGYAPHAHRPSASHAHCTSILYQYSMAT